MIRAIGKTIKWSLIGFTVMVIYFAISPASESSKPEVKIEKTVTDWAQEEGVKVYVEPVKVASVPLIKTINDFGGWSLSCPYGYKRTGDKCFIKTATDKYYSTSNSSTKVVTIIDGSAPLRSYADSKTTLIRIPDGTKLAVLDDKIIKGATSYMPDVTWYKVKFNGKTGWISQFVTKS
jgi:hypothetical protein